MMTNSYLSWFLLAPFVVLGCSWTNTVWLVPEDNTTNASGTIKLLDPQQKPADESPFALVEAKAIKTWDSQGDLIGSNIEKAKKIGATKIWCPADGQKTLLLAFPTVPTKEEIGLLKEFLIAVTDLIKAVIALPLTFRSEAISQKTLLCSVYRENR